MNRKDKSETLAHHTMAMVGGFMGVYALLMRNETFGSSETSNLIYLTVDGLNGSALDFAVRLGGTLCYIAGIMFATLMPKYVKKTDFRYISLLVDAVACLVLAQIPAGTNPLLALYPMFFATAVQWLSYTQAAGFNSATIFSTNNLRQCFSGLAEYLYSREEKHLRRFRFYGGTLIFFHIGVIYCWFCLKLWGIASIYACLLPLAVTLWATVRDCRTPRLESGY